MAINDRGAALLAYTIVFMIIPVIAIGLRFWSRAISSSERGPRYWWDDWTALSSLPFLLTSHSLVIHMITLGLGKHIQTITPNSEIEQLRALYACYIVYDISISLPKMSALLFYARVFTTQEKRFTYALWFTHFLVIGWVVSVALLGVFLCDPVEKQWKPTIAGHCHPNTVLWLTSAIPSVVIDLILLILPLPMLWQLQMKLSRKILIMAVFVCGYCVIIISLGRLITVSTTAAALNKDLTYASVPTFYWLCAEAPMSVLSICLPTFFLLFKGKFKSSRPRLFSRYNNSSKFKILRDYKKGKSSSGTTNDTLPLQGPDDHELGKPSYNSTIGNTQGTASAYCLAGAETASEHNSRAASSLPIPDSAIRVQNDVCVRTYG